MASLINPELADGRAGWRGACSGKELVEQGCALCGAGSVDPLFVTHSGVSSFALVGAYHLTVALQGKPVCIRELSNRGKLGLFHDDGAREQPELHDRFSADCSLTFFFFVETRGKRGKCFRSFSRIRAYK